ncbi:putative U3 small nucleolar ribonucleoprotein LCP5 [Blattamonas nauphoetae]|uniref:U3 small nucleolar ribonucleoprotein LCP5 n=1 Tax=Blattamonas nauphoetae TaxID=2049346 RepID=A0ABQ9YMW2_9EUKA|nr:putative U3 small nucleolar ribonucleoprotein LCP5 [Blattamonas nauphoetae]
MTSIPDDEREMIRVLSSFSSEIETLLPKIARVKSNPVGAGKGFTFLDAKNVAMSNYLVLMAQYMSSKIAGDDLTTLQDSLVLPLVEQRVITEKIDTLDSKYEHQIDKMMKIAKSGRASSTSSSILRFRPQPSQMISKLESSSNTQENDNRGKPEAYKPPKIRQHEMPTRLDREQERREKLLQNRLSNSRVVNELRAEIEDLPDRELSLADERQMLMTDAQQRRLKELQEFEEENYKRASLSKKQKKDLNLLDGSSKLSTDLHRFPTAERELQSILDDVEQIDRMLKQTIGTGGQKPTFSDGLGLDESNSDISVSEIDADIYGVGEDDGVEDSIDEEIMPTRTNRRSEKLVMSDGEESSIEDDISRPSRSIQKQKRTHSHQSKRDKVVQRRKEKKEFGKKGKPKRHNSLGSLGVSWSNDYRQGKRHKH